jgi:hypothetical protein
VTTKAMEALSVRSSGKYWTARSCAVPSAATAHRTLHQRRRSEPARRRAQSKGCRLPIPAAPPVTTTVRCCISISAPFRPPDAQPCFRSRSLLSIARRSVAFAVDGAEARR